MHVPLSPQSAPGAPLGSRMAQSPRLGLNSQKGTQLGGKGAKKEEVWLVWGKYHRPRKLPQREAGESRPWASAHLFTGTHSCGCKARNHLQQPSRNCSETPGEGGLASPVITRQSAAHKGRLVVRIGKDMKAHLEMGNRSSSEVHGAVVQGRSEGTGSPRSKAGRLFGLGGLLFSGRMV